MSRYLNNGGHVSLVPYIDFKALEDLLDEVNKKVMDSHREFLKEKNRIIQECREYIKMLENENEI